MKVNDVMSTKVVSVRPRTSFKEAVGLMISHDVGALPVLDDLARVIGIISEADLVPKAAFGGAGHRPLLALLDLFDGDAAAWQKAHARTVAELMTTRPVVVHPDDDIASAARVLVHSRRKRAPVVDDTGVLVGMVSRQDLLGAYARPDTVIADDVTAALRDPTRAPEVTALHAAVRDGVVTITGDVQTDDDRRVVAAAAWRVPGVVDVVDQLTSRHVVTTV